MELWVLDDDLLKTAVVEGYISGIWTERYDSPGDFKIDTFATVGNKSLLTVGTRLAMDESTYVMEIKTITDATNDDGEDTLSITGASLESILDDRMGISSAMASDIVNNPKLIVTDTPGNIIRAMFQAICVDAELDSGDEIPFYHSGTILPTGNIAEPSDTITVTLDPASLLTQIKTVAQTYGLGYRFVRNGETSQLYFEVYTGSDRTSAQTTLPAVIFSPDMDNLTDVTRLTSTASYKNMAYVVGKDQVAIVFGVGEDTEAAGWDRRVLFVNASSIDATNVPDVDAALSQAGLDALSKQRKIYQFDGQISENGPFKYGRDYKLGDLVEERDATGIGNQMKVTEQIFVSDDQGDRSYPTLTLSEVIVPGTWIKWTPPDEDWVDVPSDQVWGNQ